MRSAIQAPQATGAPSLDTMVITAWFSVPSLDRVDSQVVEVSIDSALVDGHQVLPDRILPSGRSTLTGVTYRVTLYGGVLTGQPVVSLESLPTNSLLGCVRMMFAPSRSVYGALAWSDTVTDRRSVAGDSGVARSITIWRAPIRSNDTITVEANSRGEATARVASGTVFRSTISGTRKMELTRRGVVLAAESRSESHATSVEPYTATIITNTYAVVTLLDLP